MKASEKAIYINQLASVAGIGLDKIAPFVNDFKPLKDKKEINIQFFKVLETVKLSKQPMEEIKVPEITAKVKVKVNVLQAKKKLETRTKKLALLVSKLEETQAEISEIWKLILDPNQEVNLTEKLKAIIDDGFWGNPILEKGILTLETTNDVICQDLDKITKLKKNLGKYRAQLDLNNLRLKVKNMKTHRHTWLNHPYVSQDGNVCWGNATGVAAGLLREQKIDKLFKLLSGLLTSHSGGGFSHLSEYQ